MELDLKPTVRNLIVLFLALTTRLALARTANDTAERELIEAVLANTEGEFHQASDAIETYYGGKRSGPPQIVLVKRECEDACHSRYLVFQGYTTTSGSTLASGYSVLALAVFVSEDYTHPKPYVHREFMFEPNRRDSTLDLANPQYGNY